LWENEVLALGDGTVLVQCGPMRMFIEGSVGGVKQVDLCRRAASEAIGFLESISLRRMELMKPAIESREPADDSPARIMWRAVRAVGDPDLTPMAAVAGTIADKTADFLEERGMTRVVVNNGGDIAIRLKGAETVTVGIRPRIDSDFISHRIRIHSEMEVGGVASSGLGGRSFTRGIASAATVFAHRAAIADASATAIANATNVQSPAVQRIRAENIDPDTDLKGLMVTGSVGALSEKEIDAALVSGMKRATELAGSGIIFGACICVMGAMRATGRVSGMIEPMPV
jgi:uncharacterized protein